jgi:TatD DNase family protein
MELVDSHCHVHDRAFDVDRAAMLERARAAGVTQLVCVGATDFMDGARKAVALAEAHAHIFATVGVHPHDVRDMTDADWDELRSLCAHPKVVGVGETGLDFFYNHSPPEAQRAAFRRFVHLALEVHKPLVVHVRDAHAEAIAILREERAREAGGQVHCFTGTVEDAREYLALDLHVSFTGIVTFRNADVLRAAARITPLDRLLVETDCPYLAPVPMRGKRNEPAHVRIIAEALASLRGESNDVLFSATTRNARQLFRLPTVTDGLAAVF